jgi:putative FmdB family regulatory protein
MPTYEYHCDACGHQFDEFQSIMEDPLKTCPECKKKKLRRAFGTGAAVLFKGAGFYETDYRSESYKSAAKADQEASTKGNGTDSGTAANGTGKSDSGGKSGKAGTKKEKS